MRRYTIDDPNGTTHVLHTEEDHSYSYRGSSLSQANREIFCDRCGSVGFAGPSHGGTVAQTVEAHRVALNMTDEDRARAARAIARLT